MKKYLELIRVKHWIKNLLIFIPVICANLLTKNNIYVTIIGFLSFSFMTSFVYIINDIKDIESDKNHPRKKNRPLANNEITEKAAIIIALIFLISSICINSCINHNIFNISLLILMSYLIINLLYSFGLKNVAILDIVVLASGFVLRVYYGASIVSINVSEWLFLTILSAALFLGLGKRKKELIHSKDSRKVLAEYNGAFLDKFQYLSLSLMIVFYSLWTISQKTDYLVFTIPLLIIIFMKYCLIIEKSDEGDPTTILYQDKGLLSLCIIYGLIMLILLAVI